MQNPRRRQTNFTESLVQELNHLLSSLSLPITIVTPHDLTPSLLLAVLESILRSRLPISEATRKSQTPASKVEAMKVFLGVLEYDILQVDIGLSEIDPRRLAAGEWDDIIFVGETLCWITRHRPIYFPPRVMQDSGESSSADSNGHASENTGFSQIDASETSATTVQDGHTPRADTLLISREVPRCIHEVETVSFSTEAHVIDPDASEGFCNCSEIDIHSDGSPSSSAAANKTSDRNSSGSTRSSVRYEGYIVPADDDIPAFVEWQERSRAQTKSQTPRRNNSPRDWSDIPPSSPAHISSPYYTLSLLQERARLLGELAKLTVEESQHLHQTDA